MYIVGKGFFLYWNNSNVSWAFRSEWTLSLPLLFIRRIWKPNEPVTVWILNLFLKLCITTIGFHALAFMIIIFTVDFWKLPNLQVHQCILPIKITGTAWYKKIWNFLVFVNIGNISYYLYQNIPVINSYTGTYIYMYSSLKYLWKWRNYFYVVYGAIFTRMKGF